MHPQLNKLRTESISSTCHFQNVARHSDLRSTAETFESPDKFLFIEPLISPNSPRLSHITVTEYVLAFRLTTKYTSSLTCSVISHGTETKRMLGIWVWDCKNNISYVGYLYECVALTRLLLMRQEVIPCDRLFTMYRFKISIALTNSSHRHRNGGFKIAFDRLVLRKAQQCRKRCDCSCWLYLKSATEAGFGPFPRWENDIQTLTGKPLNTRTILPYKWVCVTVTLSTIFGCFLCLPLIICFSDNYIYPLAWNNLYSLKNLKFPWSKYPIQIYEALC